jgi:hypothetical protein
MYLWRELIFSFQVPSAGLVTIGYTATASAGVRGLALNVQLSNNATAVYTDIVSIYPAYNTFIDYVYGHLDSALGDGHPFANPGATGAINSPSSFFTICMGVLNSTGDPAPAAVPDLITFRIQAAERVFHWLRFHRTRYAAAWSGTILAP